MNATMFDPSGKDEDGYDFLDENERMVVTKRNNESINFINSENKTKYEDLYKENVWDYYGEKKQSLINMNRATGLLDMSNTLGKETAEIQITKGGGDFNEKFRGDGIHHDLFLDARIEEVWPEGLSVSSIFDFIETVQIQLLGNTFGTTMSGKTLYDMFSLQPKREQQNLFQEVWKHDRSDSVSIAEYFAENPTCYAKLLGPYSNTTLGGKNPITALFLDSDVRDSIKLRIKLKKPSDAFIIDETVYTGTGSDAELLTYYPTFQVAFHYYSKSNIFLNNYVNEIYKKPKSFSRPWIQTTSDIETKAAKLGKTINFEYSLKKNEMVNYLGLVISATLETDKGYIKSLPFKSFQLKQSSSTLFPFEDNASKILNTLFYDQFGYYPIDDNMLYIPFNMLPSESSVYSGSIPGNSDYTAYMTVDLTKFAGINPVSEVNVSLHITPVFLAHVTIGKKGATYGYWGAETSPIDPKNFKYNRK